MIIFSLPITYTFFLDLLHIVVHSFLVNAFLISGNLKEAKDIGMNKTFLLPQGKTSHVERARDINK